MSYEDYYARTTSRHDTGLKLVLGGTGLGKTSAIPKVVRDIVPQDKKCIYIANRNQLLKEMQDELDVYECRLLPRDLVAVTDTLKQYWRSIDDWLENDQFRAEAAKHNIDIQQIRRTCEELRRLDDISKIQIESFERQIDYNARSIVMHGFRTIIARTDSEEFKKKLLDDPAIQSMFPFIAFERNKEVRILLITLHKAFHGFFDGEKRANLTDLKDYILFLDEFDFLENDLVGLICSSPQISDIFRFVELFYQEMVRHKLPLPSYPSPDAENYRNRIIDIAESVEELYDRGINYPSINQFTRSKDSDNAAIFRTSHIVTSQALYLEPTGRAFEIIDETEDEDPIRAQELFNRIGGVSERIISLFKELEIMHPPIYEEMLWQCYRGTSFYNELQRITHFPISKQSQRTRQDDLLEYGFSLYDINKLDQQTDREEIELRHYSTYTTPERMLKTVAQNNLVFGLSATADIPRVIHHFDMEWLRHQDELVIPIDDDDRDDIEHETKVKASTRQTDLTVVKLQQLERSSRLEKNLRSTIDNIASLDEAFGDGQDPQKNRQKRVESFFALLLWVCNSPEQVSGHSHLVFVNSFRQIRLVITKYGDLARELFSATRRTENRWFDAYDLSFEDEEFIVVFYNAEQAKRVRTSDEATEAFNRLFHEGKHVVVVTQFLSAGNGVNLQYLDEDGNEQDFKNLYLLEQPYFYFGNPNKQETFEEKTASIKENVWYLAKLHEAKLLSRGMFRQRLTELHKPGAWNRLYHQLPSTREDSLLNRLSALIQAIGRIERKWEPTHRQTIVMHPEVWNTFQVFIRQFGYIRNKRERIISDNLRQVLEQIESKVRDFERARRREKDSRLAIVNNQCRDKIGQLVASLNDVRQHGDEQVRREWEHLRHDVLSHNFGSEILRNYMATYETDIISDGIVYLTSEDEILPAELYDSSNDRHLRLDAVYDLISENEVVRKYFASRGYEMSFRHSNHTIFTPYCYQAILQGAIGEEACKALLLFKLDPQKQLISTGLKLEPIPDELFEIADLKLKHLPFYIDCKNLSDFTMGRFGLPPDDLYWHYELNDDRFREKALEKYKLISSFEGHNAKLIYLNLASRHEAPPEFYDADFAPVDYFDDAQIIIIRGCLLVEEPNEYHPAFKQLLDRLQNRRAQ